ncbi:hypothetical protein Efla_006874 [Eimeria flavescens]
MYLPQVRRRAASDKDACVEYSAKAMVSSIALLKLAYEGALTLTRSLGSPVLQRICVAVTVFAASKQQALCLTGPHALENHIALSLGGAREASERNSLRAAAIALSQVLNYRVGMQLCMTLLVENEL